MAIRTRAVDGTTWIELSTPWWWTLAKWVSIGPVLSLFAAGASAAIVVGIDGLLDRVAYGLTVAMGLRSRIPVRVEAGEGWGFLVAGIAVLVAFASLAVVALQAVCLRLRVRDGRVTIMESPPFATDPVDIGSMRLSKATKSWLAEIETAEGVLPLNAEFAGRDVASLERLLERAGVPAVDTAAPIDPNTSAG